MQFADLIAPLEPDAFLSGVYGRRPVHIPGEAIRVAFSRAELDALFDAHPQHWTPARLKIVYNTLPIPPDQYCRPTNGVWLADAARAREFGARGASLIADELQKVAPNLAAVASVLSRALGGMVGANAYLSSGGVQAFGPHYDLSEVFAFHVEGEKRWRIYENRAENPVAFPDGDEASVRAEFRRTAGGVAQEIVMRPGDALYIPRGWYHDALAESATSMHVTFSVQPHTGKLVLRLLEALALKEPPFRRYLPDAELAGEAALAAHLETLAARLHDLARSPDLIDAVRRGQAMLRS